MITLIIGGSGSGKSEYAENLVVGYGEERRIYIATMKPWDEECEQRIYRHRKMREKKQFRTRECYRDLKSLNLMDEGKKPDVLLECMSNLVSNELFGLGDGERGFSSEQVVKEVITGILKVAEQTRHFTIVTNEVFSDGDCYSEETNVYRKTLALINQKIGAMADQVIEVIAGIPVFLKVIN